MAGFKHSVELIQEPGAERLVDTSNGRVLRLTTTEARMVALYDGLRSPQALAAMAREAGVDVDEGQVSALVARLSKNGFLEASEAPAPVAEGGDLSVDQVVPLFREDLQVTPRPGSKAVLEVLDPVKGRSFSLYDFEVSIARMLNGKRTVAEVSETAAKIGIPVTTATLSRFIRQMRAYGFIAEQPPAQKGFWDQRRQWSAEVRGLYQSALRLFRANRYEDCLEYLGALLEIDPENPDAKELKQRVDEAQGGVVEVPLSFDALFGEPPPPVAGAPPAPLPQKTVAQYKFSTSPEQPPGEAPPAGVPQKTVAQYRIGGLAVPQEPPPAEAAPSPFELQPAPAPPEPGFPPSSESSPGTSTGELGTSTGDLGPARPKRSKLPVVALVLLLGALVGSAFFPVAQRVEVVGTVGPLQAAEPTVPRKGELAELKVADKAPVHKGDLLATLSTAKLEQRRKELLGAAAKARRDGQALAAAVRPAARKKPEQALARAQKELAKAEAALKGARGAKLARAQRGAEAKRAAVEQARAALALALGGKQRAELEEKAKGLEREAAELPALIELSRVVAPADGVFLAPADARPGLALEVGAPFGRIVEAGRRQVVGDAVGDVAHADPGAATAAGRPVALQEPRFEDRKFKALVEASALPEGPVHLEMPAGRKFLYRVVLKQ